MGSVPLAMPFCVSFLAFASSSGWLDSTDRQSVPWGASPDPGVFWDMCSLSEHFWNTASIWGSFPSHVRCNHLTIAFRWKKPVNTVGLNACEAERSGKPKDNVGTRTQRDQVALNKFRLEIRKTFLTIWSWHRLTEVVKRAKKAIVIRRELKLFMKGIVHCSACSCRTKFKEQIRKDL